MGIARLISSLSSPRLAMQDHGEHWYGYCRSDRRRTGSRLQRRGSQVGGLENKMHFSNNCMLNCSSHLLCCSSRFSSREVNLAVHRKQLYVCRLRPLSPKLAQRTPAPSSWSLFRFFRSSSFGGKTSGPKLNGNNSPIVLTINLPSLLNMKMGVSRDKNSRRNWRHMPQGEQ